MRKLNGGKLRKLKRRMMLKKKMMNISTKQAIIRVKHPKSRLKLRKLKAN